MSFAKKSIDEVGEWLKAENFSENTVQIFSGEYLYYLSCNVRLIDIASNLSKAGLFINSILVFCLLPNANIFHCSSLPENEVDGGGISSSDRRPN